MNDEWTGIYDKNIFYYLSLAGFTLQSPVHMQAPQERGSELPTLHAFSQVLRVSLTCQGVSPADPRQTWDRMAGSGLSP